MPNVSPLHELALLYLAMAQSGTADLSYAEGEAVTDSLHSRYAYLSRAEVQNVVLEAFTTYDGEVLREAARQVVDTLGEILSDEEKGDTLEDLVHIARADGVILARERRLLDDIAANWAVALPLAEAASPRAETDVASWGALHHLAFIYLVLAHAPDSDFSAEERQLILKKLQEWEPALTEHAIEAVLDRAIDRYAQGPHPAMLIASVEAVKVALSVSQRQVALNNLVQIANADGVFLDSEEDLLNDLRTAWDLDAF